MPSAVRSPLDTARHAWNMTIRMTIRVAEYSEQKQFI